MLFTALNALVGGPSSPANLSTPREETADLRHLALSPLAFPTIAPPFAVGVLVVFAAFCPDLASPGKMLAVACGLRLIDDVAMRGARQILVVIGTSTLRLLGAVFAVLQLALAVQMMFWAGKSTFASS